MMKRGSLAILRNARRMVLTVAARFSRGFATDQSGIAAIEFAILLPVMLLLYIGTIEISDGFMVKRKIANATNSIGDLVARAETISKREMVTLIDAAEAVASPYPGDRLRIRVSGVWIDDKSVATVVWGAARNDTPRQRDAVVSIPDGVKTNESFLVVAEVTTKYTPLFGLVITGNIDFNNKVYLKPRVSGTVCYDGLCDLN
jgi:Flp pilus assembly protein TadG